MNPAQEKLNALDRPGLLAAAEETRLRLQRLDYRGCYWDADIVKKLMDITSEADKKTDGVPRDQFHAFTVAMLGEVEKAGGDMFNALYLAAQAGVKVASDEEARPEFVAYNMSGIPDGEIVEVRERGSHVNVMKVGSLQFKAALGDLGNAMPVRRATAEQRKGW